MVKEIISRLFRLKTNDATGNGFAVGNGNQRLVDPLLIYSAKGLKREDKLALYYSIVHSQPLATGAINVVTRFVNSRPIFRSGNVEVDRRSKQIWSDIKGAEVNGQLVRNGCTYGFSAGEIVFPTGTIERVVVPESPMIRYVADQYGQVTDVMQLQGSVFSPLDPKSRIPANKFVMWTRDKTSFTDFYGSSLFETVCGMLEYLCQTMNAFISVVLRAGKPRFHVTIDNTGITPEQFKERMELVKSHFQSLGNLESQDLFLPPGCSVSIIGSESFAQKFQLEVQQILQCYLAGVGLPPALLSLVTQASAGTESFLRQQILCLQSQMYEYQDAIATAWNSSFWKLVQALEGMPVAPVIEFEAPRLLEMLQEENARKAKFDNDLRECQAKIRPPEWLAMQCGADDVHDLAGLTEFIGQQGTIKQDSGNDTANITKATDERAVNNDNM